MYDQVPLSNVMKEISAKPNTSPIATAMDTIARPDAFFNIAASAATNSA